MNRETLQSTLSRPSVIALVLALLVALLYLPWLGYNDLLHEETRRAVIARTMMESGDYLVPYLAERIYLSKPPLFNWLIAATSLPGGTVTEFTARLPSVIALGALAVFMVATVGQRLGVGARWLLGLSLVVTGELMHKAVLSELEVVFTLLVSASLWTWFELDQRGRRGLMLWLPPAILVAAAFLTKREPALVFYYLGIGGYLAIQGRFRELFSPAHLVAAAVTGGLIAAWLVPMIHRAGLDAVLENLHQEVLTRGLSPAFSDYVTHFLRYPLEIVVAALPASPLVLALAWPRVRRLVQQRHGPMLVFALVTLLINLPLYWLRAEAAVRYFLPMFPTLLVLAAMVYDTLATASREWPAWPRRMQYGFALLLLAVTAVLAGTAVVLAIPGLFPEVAGPLIPAPLMAGLGFAVLALLGWLLLRHRHRTAVVVFVAIVSFGVTLRGVVIGYRIPYKAERIVDEHDDMPAVLAELRARLPQGVDRVQAIGGMPHAVWFYDRDQLVIPEARHERSGRPASDHLLVWAPKRERIELPDVELETVARVPYEDGDFLLMRLRRPATD